MFYWDWGIQFSIYHTFILNGPHFGQEDSFSPCSLSDNLPNSFHETKLIVPVVFKCTSLLLICYIFTYIYIQVYMHTLYTEALAVIRGGSGPGALWNN